MSYSHMGTPTLPSALTHFTSEFGMGSGGSMSLLSLSKNVMLIKFHLINQSWKALLSRVYKYLSYSITKCVTCTDALMSMRFMDERFSSTDVLPSFVSLHTI